MQIQYYLCAGRRAIHSWRGPCFPLLVPVPVHWLAAWGLRGWSDDDDDDVCVVPGLSSADWGDWQQMYWS